MSSSETDSTAASHAYSDLTDCDTNNATTIDWQSVDEDSYWLADHLYLKKKDHFQYLDRLNGGRQNGPGWQNKSYLTHESNRHLIHCVGGRMGLTERQLTYATRLLDGLQRSNTGHKSEVVAFCTCAYILHRDDERGKAHPQVQPDERDHLVEHCRDIYDVSQTTFETVYGRIASRIRNDKLEPQRHDDYEVDPGSPQSWRTPTEDNHKLL